MTGGVAARRSENRSQFSGLSGVAAAEFETMETSAENTIPALS
jgi:hypothetical protein